MNVCGELLERYYDRHGLRVDIRVRTAGERFRVAVCLNGCEDTAVSRPSVGTALAWGRGRAEEILAEFGLGAVQLSFAEAS